MQTKSWALALALALASTSVAESRPRIYYPRHVKRQVTNSGETLDAIFPPASTPASKSKGNGQDEQNEQGDRDEQDGSNGGLVDGLLKGSKNKDDDSNQDEDSGVLTINVPNTVVVESTGAPSGKANDENEDANPNALTLPTPPPDSSSQDEDTGNTDTPADSSPEPSTDSSTESKGKSDSDDDKGAVTIAPTGVVPEENSQGDQNDDGVVDAIGLGKGSDQDAADEASADETPTNETPTDEKPSDKLPVVGDVTDALGLGKGKAEDPVDEKPADEKPADEKPADEKPADEKPVTETPVDETPVDETPVDETPVDETPVDETPTNDEPTDEKDDDDTGIVGGIIGGILGPDNTTETPNTDEPTGIIPPITVGTDDPEGSQQPPTTPDDTDLPPNEGNVPEDTDDENTEDETDHEPPTPVVTPPPDSDPLDPITGPVSSIISDIGDDVDIPLPPVVNNTDPIGDGAGGNDGTITIPGTEEPTNEPGGEEPNGPAQPGGDPTETPPLPNETSGPTVPAGNDPGETGGQSTPPVETGSPTEPGPTPPPTLVPGPSDDEGDDGPVNEPPVGNSTITGGQNEPTPPPNAGPNVVEPASTVTSIAVLSTVTGTTAWLGTELAADKTAAAGEQVEAPAPTHSADTLPAGMPKTIEATEDDNPVQPEGTTLIRIVFDRRLHYEFVADNFTAAQQILTFLPKIISFGENVDASKIQMMRLAPVDSNNKDWFPTGAYLYVPASIIPPLSADIHLPNSLLYHHDSPVAFQLAAAIDPSFGIIPGSENNGQGAEKDPGGAPFTNSEDKPEEQTPQQKGATAGITIGTVTVAVAYGAAMFIVARRYKRKKQAHRRASSITNTSDMRYSPSGSPAMMGGALLSRDFSGYGGVAGGRESHGSGRSGAGNSGRTAYISAPVAAENSLGWN